MREGYRPTFTTIDRDSPSETQSRMAFLLQSPSSRVGVWTQRSKVRSQDSVKLLSCSSVLYYVIHSEIQRHESGTGTKLNRFSCRRVGHNRQWQRER